MILHLCFYLFFLITCSHANDVYFNNSAGYLCNPCQFNDAAIWMYGEIPVDKDHVYINVNNQVYIEMVYPCLYSSLSTQIISYFHTMKMYRIILIYCYSIMQLYGCIVQLLLIKIMFINVHIFIKYSTKNIIIIKDKNSHFLLQEYLCRYILIQKKEKAKGKKRKTEKKRGLKKKGEVLNQLQKNRRGLSENFFQLFFF